MNRSEGATAGVTLIELLMVMALLGIMMLTMANVQSSTMDASTVVVGQANRLRDLQDASGYLADRLRSASMVQTDPLLTVNGEACQINSATSPCFAVLVSEVRQVGTTPQYTPNAYRYLAYRMMPRKLVPIDDRATDAWADDNTMALVEYRQVVCEPEAYPAGAATPGQCTSSAVAPPGYATIPSTVPVALTGMKMNVLMDYATTDNVTGVFTPFVYADLYAPAATVPPAPATLANRTFTLSLRAKRREGSTVRYTPTTGPLTLNVKQRN